ncbi:MAG: hypothetical protein QHH43_08320 [Candidatus Saccharicenans sp.]|jgi:hypothetical protein|nr:hypothetical protein [Candidatus Saccharicenans sp.]MDH7575745.1 hypothetical protein [Candidatus Saccharicenans sp.]
MKKLSLILSLILLASSCIMYVPYDESRNRSVSSYEPPPTPAAPVYGEISISFIYDYLGNYGYWIYYNPYGYVWIPRGVGRHWRPYTHGRWVWTEYGWTWVSHHPWGWIPFHYGRWGWDNRLGWFWVPDVVWAPAWVIWRFGDLYIGWAPLPPGVDFVPGFGLRWGRRDLPNYYWIFIEGRRFYANQLQPWILPPERNITIINYTVVRDRYTVRGRDMVINDALSPQEIERLTRRPVTKVSVREVKKPEEAGGGIDEVRIYRPQIKQEQTAPKTVLKREEAEQKIGPVREDRPEEVEIIHRQESSLLERTQRLELERLKRQAEEEARNAPPQERQKKLIEVQSRLEELKKKHEQEKQEMQKRQAEEKRVIRKEDLKRKTDEEKR